MGQVLSMEVIEEDLQDTKMLKPLVKGFLKVKSVKKARGDGADESRANYVLVPVQQWHRAGNRAEKRKTSVPKAMGG